MHRKTKIKILSKLLAKKSPKRHSLIGPEAEKNDFFSLHIYKNGNPYLLLQNISDAEVECLKWNGTKFNDIVKLKIDEIDIKEIDITHYYKASIIEFNSIFDYRFHSLFRLIYIKTSLIRIYSKIVQKLYNKRELVLPRRMDILKKIVKQTIGDKTTQLSPIDVISLFHSKKWILRPDNDKLIDEMTLYLESLVSTSELSTSGYKYSINAKALVTLNSYEEQERKHLNQIKISKAMMWATISIAFFALAQLYLQYIENNPR